MQDTRSPKYTPEQLEVRRKWREALRSGKYAQTTGHLRDSRGYCCLGVLCDVVEPSGWNETPTARGLIFHRRNASVPRDHIRDTAGVWHWQPFTFANDDLGKSFAEIADMIEAEEAAA